MPQNDPYIIKIYMVTYKNTECVKNNLDSLYASMDALHEDQTNVRLWINIINNHSSFYLPSEYEDTIMVHENMRIDESCGHLARDWNYALIDGFRNLDAPTAHQVICVHDDFVWNPDWLDKLLEIHKKYDFYIGDYGCTFHSYLPSAVKRIGLWDERFCNIGYHEADYMLRARIYNPERSSINDHVQGRLWNETELLGSHPPHNADKSVAANESLRFHPISRRVFEQKWGIYPERWADSGVLQSPPARPLIPGYLFYPYFEQTIETLDEQNYVTAWEFEQRWHNIS